MNYIKFTEHNDWEGETWHFYLPVENICNLERFQDAIKKAIEGDAYELGEKYIPEEEVNILVKHSHGGYMSTQNKVRGVMTEEKLKSLEEDLKMLDNEEDDWEDVLYKGGITNYFIND